MRIENLLNNQTMPAANYQRDAIHDLSNKSVRFQEILDNQINISKSVNKTNSSGARVKDERLMDVCIQMESIFVARMLKEMRNTVHKGELFNGGFPEKIFEDMLYDEYALNLSKNANLGLATMLYKELSKK